MNLKQLYPQPRRVILRDSFWWLALGAALTLAIVSLMDGATLPALLDAELLMLKKSALLTGVIGVLIVRMTYGLLYRATYQYRIERGRLQIIRGVILKEEALLPLMPLTELYVKRSWLDLFFGLSNVYAAVILERAQKIGEIRGLRHRDALKVRDEILRVIESQQQLPPTPYVAPASSSSVVLPKRLPYSLDTCEEGQPEDISAPHDRPEVRLNKQPRRLDCIDVH